MPATALSEAALNTTQRIARPSAIPGRFLALIGHSANRALAGSTLQRYTVQGTRYKVHGTRYTVGVPGDAGVFGAYYCRAHLPRRFNRWRVVLSLDPHSLQLPAEHSHEVVVVGFQRSCDVGVYESEPVGHVHQVATFDGRTECDVKKVQVLAVAAACRSFNDVGRH